MPPTFDHEKTVTMLIGLIKANSDYRMREVGEESG